MKHLLLFLGLFFAGVFGPSIDGFSIASAQQAMLYFVPASSTVSPGQTFRVTVMVDTKGDFANAVAAYFMYPLDKLDALAVDRTGSVMTLFAEDKAAAGRVDISGGTPTPGFAGIQKIASVDFRVKPTATGMATLSFLSDAAVLRNSDNQNIISLGSSGKATFQIGQAVPPPAGGPVPIPMPPPAGGPTSTPPPTGGPTEALVIFDIRAEKIDEEHILVSWKTNRPANSQVDYGQSSEPEFSVLDGKFTTEHSIVLTGVKASVRYSFQILGFDEFGGKAQSDMKEYIGQADSPTSPPQAQDRKFEIGGFGISLPFLIAFVILPILVVIVVAVLLFFRMRARS